MEDLILADDDRIEPNGHRDGMARGLVPNQLISAQRQHRGEGAAAGIAPCVKLDAVARLEQQAAWLGRLPQATGEALSLLGRYVPGVGDEGDDALPFVRH